MAVRICPGAPSLVVRRRPLRHGFTEDLVENPRAAYPRAALNALDTVGALVIDLDRESAVFEKVEIFGEKSSRGKSIG